MEVSYVTRTIRPTSRVNEILGSPALPLLAMSITREQLRRLIVNCTNLRASL